LIRLEIASKQFIRRKSWWREFSDLGVSLTQYSQLENWIHVVLCQRMLMSFIGALHRHAERKWSIHSNSDHLTSENFQSQNLLKKADRRSLAGIDQQLSL
jgi:hypothetical protein